MKKSALIGLGIVAGIALLANLLIRDPTSAPRTVSHPAPEPAATPQSTIAATPTAQPSPSAIDQPPPSTEVASQPEWKARFEAQGCRVDKQDGPEVRGLTVSKKEPTFSLWRADSVSNQPNTVFGFSLTVEDHRVTTEQGITSEQLQAMKKSLLTLATSDPTFALALEYCAATLAVDASELRSGVLKALQSSELSMPLQESTLGKMRYLKAESQKTEIVPVKGLEFWISEQLLVDNAFMLGFAVATPKDGVALSSADTFDSGKRR